MPQNHRLGPTSLLLGLGLLLLCAVPMLPGCGRDTTPGTEAHETMAYADEWQRPVPPEAISPFEPTEVTYVDEPLIELDSDWNLDVKLFSKYRYTDEFVRRWKAKYDYTPTRPVKSVREFFEAVDLDRPGLEEVKEAIRVGGTDAAMDAYLAYQRARPRPYHPESPPFSEEAGKTAVERASRILEDADFPACHTGSRYSLWALMGDLERAYLHTRDAKYARAWLEMFHHWYVNHRPPAQRPKTYIGFMWMPYWRTLGASGPARRLTEVEAWLEDESDALDRNELFSLYASILEHAEFLELVNDVFLPGNWQTCQCWALMDLGTYFPSFKGARYWREHAWDLAKAHVARETLDDGTHIENSVGYAVGVIRHYVNMARLARTTGMEVPEEYLRQWKSMYLWAVKILPPTGSGVPVGDGGLGPDGSLVKGAIIDGALEFGDPTLKYFAAQYPEDVRKRAQQEFENPKEVLAAYEQIEAKPPPFTSILLPDAGWGVMRTSWDRDALCLFADCGWDEAWHSQPDFGSFDIWAYGEPLITECGRTGAYEADISKRWYKQTIAHNTVMVDSRSMRKCVDNRVDRWWTGPGYDGLDATSDGYRWIGILHHRRFLFVKPDYWIITDFLPGPGHYRASFQTSGYHEFDWLVHFQPTTLRIDETTKRIDTTNEHANVALVPLNAQEVDVRESVGPVVARDGVAEVPYVSLHQERSGFAQYQVLLLPYRGSQAPEIDIRRLEADAADRVHRQNVGYEIEVLGRTDVFLESGDPTTKVSFGDYVLRGAVAHIRDAGSSEAGCLLVEADYLSHRGTVLFSAPRVVAAIEFAVHGPTGEDAPASEDTVLEIATESDVSGVRIHAPGVTTVRVSGEERGYVRDGDSVVLE